MSYVKVAVGFGGEASAYDVCVYGGVFGEEGGGVDGP